MVILDSPNCYSIGWIAALPIERAVATALLDEHHKAPAGFDQHPSDTNAYTWGKIGAHNIEVAREPRETTDPEVHFGIIASGNQVVADAAARDRMADLVGEACLCFEMEAAGLMASFPCLAVRGISDYADSHENAQWQRYASATAAAYAKDLLGYVPARQLRDTRPAAQAINSSQSSVTDFMLDRPTCYLTHVKWPKT
ncbi:hypothetical protein CDD83_2240 [Cordyceps sp. RAO-2017]|nr:hypothetical protein CDD83_2240 [Cordyceps sp. RAO-2017]